MKISQLLLCSLLSQLLLWKVKAQSLTKIVNTLSGPVQGTTEKFHGYTVNQYLGIPFAQPPIGQLRFRKPVPVKPWTNVYLADRNGPGCIQHMKYSYPYYDNGYKSEDCLFLNIWVPQSENFINGDKKIPVLFYIYGGGFVYGSNKIPIYNGLAVAAEGDIVVVTINFRPATLGYFTTGTETAPGNVGLYDILEALKWVNKNIGAFGGDPNQLTLNGQSSGAVTVGLFCISPLTKGLFSRVIMESGSPAHFSSNNINVNLNKSQTIAEKVRCANQTTTIYNDPNTVADCMREKSASDIIEPIHYFPSVISQSITPHYGDEILPIDPRTALMTGQFHKVDVLIGNTHDEGSVKLIGYNTTLFGPYGKKSPEIDKTLGISILEDIFKDKPFKDDIIQYYLENKDYKNYNKIREQVYTCIGDFSLLCPTKYFAEIYSRSENPVYYYNFVHRSTISPWAKWVKVLHFAEVPYAFGNPLLDPDNYTSEEILLSSRIIRIWSNFVKYGSPECPDQSEYPESDWPLYSRDKPVYVILGTKTKKSRKGYDEGPHWKNCEFYRTYFGFA